MKTRMVKGRWLAVGVVVAGLAGMTVMAQAPGGPRAAVKTGGPTRIRSVIGCGPRFLIPTPEYTTTISRGKTPAGKWAVITVEYDTTPEWIDELFFQYYVVTFNRHAKDPKDTYSMFKGNVTYIDVAKERRHISTIYLRPSTVQRYGEVIGIAVEILLNGEVIETKAETLDPKMQGEWWKSPKITPKDGYLVDKGRTPFAFVNYDEEETIKR